MSYWFDNTSKRWRVRIKRRGKELSRYLPQGTTEEEAKEYHERALREFTVEELFSAPIQRYQAEWERDVYDGTVKHTGWVRRMFSGAKGRAAFVGREFTLTMEELTEVCIESGGHCQVSGVKLRRGEGKRNPYSPSLDRIDNSRGYTKDNVRLVCALVNIGMNEWGEAAFKEVAIGMLLQHYGAWKQVFEKPRVKNCTISEVLEGEPVITNQRS